jgi:putative thymidine phosphorylase
MLFKIKLLNWSAGRPVIIIGKKIAEKLTLHVNDRVLIIHEGGRTVAVVDLSSKILKEDEVAVSDEIIEVLGLKETSLIELSFVPQPKSINLILKKLNGYRLKKHEIEIIIKDIVTNALTEAEIAYFVAAVYKNGMTFSETKNLTEAMVNSGEKLNLRQPFIVDKHSIGGVAGNRVTPILVSICASAGLIMPKTSSRAITSAAGTADVIEAVARVEFKLDEIKEIISKTNACIVWGGSLGISPADDKLIQIEKLINIDPEAQLLASIMSKKIAVGSKYVLIDIPYGVSAKVDKKQALSLKNKFEKLAKVFKIKMKCILTDGSQPIGNGIGPILEIKDVLSVLNLKEDRPLDLENKSLLIAGEILELAGKAKKGKGIMIAKRILYSGEALDKFKEIIEAQGGKLDGLKEAEFKKEILAEKIGKIIKIDNKIMNSLGRILGAPADKAAGIYLFKHVGDKIKKGEKIMTLFSESKEKMKNALEFYKENPTILK